MRRANAAEGLTSLERVRGGGPGVLAAVMVRAMVDMAQPWVAERFGVVADAFRRNFTDPGDDAAAVAVFHRGRKVVDLWAGADVVNQRPMPGDGLMMVASCSKGITATVLAMLVERGVLNPEERVVASWPEFGAGGKEHVSLKWFENLDFTRQAGSVAQVYLMLIATTPLTGRMLPWVLAPTAALTQEQAAT